MFSILGFLAFLGAYIACLNGLSEALFDISLWRLVARWWEYDAFRYLCLFLNLLTVSAALIFGAMLHPLQVLLFGKTKPYILLGKGQGGNLYVSELLKPRDEMTLKCHFLSEGSANLEALYRRIMLTEYRGQNFGPLEFRLFRTGVGLVSAVLCLFFPAIANLLIFKIYAYENSLYPEHIVGKTANLEGLFSLLNSQNSFDFYPWFLGLLLVFLLIFLIQYLARPKNLFADDRLINFSAKIRDGLKMEAQLVSKEDHYTRPTKTKKSVLSRTDYLLRLEEPFRPGVYITWICDADSKDLRRAVEACMAENRPITVQIIGPEPEETAFGVEVISA